MAYYTTFEAILFYLMININIFFNFVTILNKDYILSKWNITLFKKINGVLKCILKFF
jgi:hypothetical protein